MNWIETIWVRCCSYTFYSTFICISLSKFESTMRSFPEKWKEEEISLSLVF